jgi:hypothetical protein
VDRSPFHSFTLLVVYGLWGLLNGILQTFVTMLSDVEAQSSREATPAALGDMPAILPSSEARRNPSSEALSDLLENKAAISDPSDAEHPSSLTIESSGSDQYSVCIYLHDCASADL